MNKYNQMSTLKLLFESDMQYLNKDNTINVMYSNTVFEYSTCIMILLY